MLFKGFWENLEKPIIGLSPMDGVTDAAFRYMMAKYSKPAVSITEFTNVEGLARGASEMLKAFLYDDIERPVVAQLYGVEVDSYYKCAVMLCEMGFDGIDINMGCPANKVAKKGSGAALIKTPELAKELIRTCKRAVKDWSEGLTMEQAGGHEDVIARVREILAGKVFEKRMIPVSVKTRIGFDEVIAEEWTKQLLEELPANITMHGRTLRQMYMGKADWEAIARAAAVARGSGVSFLGNGDIASMEDAHEKVAQYGVDGVLVGRSTFGEPWFFKGYKPTVEERFEVLQEHCRYFEQLGHLPFHVIKKHLAWYCKEFSGARDLRKNLMQVENSQDVKSVLANFRNGTQET
ncbi:tRNA-dihydrouridine synthase [Candidatus Peregrinibacteria bacterium]|nr:tRNA-dihydrouridine synthase [Candidatus Peregrinibacteria bacterium]